jgi:hypothetical protein
MRWKTVKKRWHLEGLTAINNCKPTISFHPITWWYERNCKFLSDSTESEQDTISVESHNQRYEDPSTLYVICHTLQRLNSYHHVCLFSNTYSPKDANLHVSYWTGHHWIKIWVSPKVHSQRPVFAYLTTKGAIIDTKLHWSNAFEANWGEVSDNRSPWIDF